MSQEVVVESLEYPTNTKSGNTFHLTAHPQSDATEICEDEGGAYAKYA